MAKDKILAVDCKTVQQWSNLYIENRLPEEHLPAFLVHVKQCPVCREDLMVNYSILTALSQLSNNEDFSESYVHEMEEKMAESEARLKRIKKSARNLRILIVLLCVCVGFVLGLTDAKNTVYTYLPETMESSMQLNYYGVPKEYDSVYQAIIEHNDSVIEHLRERNKSNSE